MTQFCSGYYNEARILDPDTLDTAVVLPNMPGAVNSFLSGRTYPLEGTTVLFPQNAPYTDPVTLLVCGGSGTDNQFGQALDNCVSIQPEVENPEWTIERMVSCISSIIRPCTKYYPSAIQTCHDLRCKCYFISILAQAHDYLLRNLGQYVKVFEAKFQYVLTNCLSSS